MRVLTVRARTVLLAVGILAGCTGNIGEGTGSPGSGNTTGSGTGNTTGSGSAGNGASGTAGSGAAGATGVAGAGNASGAAGTSGTVPGQLNLDGAPKYFRVVRLTNTQWAQAVQTVLTVPSGGLEQNFASPVTGTTDFSNNELVLGLDSRNWQDYQTAAETLAAQVTATDTALRAVYNGTDPAGLISTLGRRAYRRPLTTAEQTTYMTLYNQGSSLVGTRSTFAKGASLVIRMMLQSPYFLYRTELGATGAPLSGYEVAAKDRKSVV